MAGHGRGRALIRLGLVGEGMAALDETMVAVVSGEVSPLVVGAIYCGVLEACQEVYDVRRACEWTAVFSRWCDGQPDLVPYRGPCLVHRVELMRLRGDWEDALEEARRACDWLSLPATPEGPAEAFYQLGELCRLRGDVAGAEEAYRQASRLGRAPEPGIALLWLADGTIEEFKRLALTKESAFGPRLIEQPQAHAGLARSEALVRSARTYWYENVATVWNTAACGKTPSQQELTEMRLATLMVVENCLAAADLVYRLAGTSAVFQSSPLERCWRDVHTAAQHFQVQVGRWETAGRALLGLDPDSPVL